MSKENKKIKKEITTDKAEELKTLVEENLELTKENQKTLEKLRSYLLWGRIWGFIKILIIVIPIALGIIYLPPLVNDIFKDFKQNISINLSNLGFNNDSSSVETENNLK